MLAAIHSPSGYVHGGLSDDNRVVLPEGHRVIDWQRPLRRPVARDLANLLATLGFDPRRHVAAGAARLIYRLHIAWFAQCARSRFPPGAATDDAAGGRLVAQVAHRDNSACESRLPLRSRTAPSRATVTR